MKEYEVTVFFYNPNIHGPEEYELRLNEIRLLCRSLGLELIEGRYDPERFFSLVGPLASTGEGGERCAACFRLRLEESCRQASGIGATVVTTTLTVSPHKNAAVVNREGVEAARKLGLAFLEADFKKKNGYRISCELSREHGFYRQNYCGCTYSKAESDQRKNTLETHRRG